MTVLAWWTSNQPTMPRCFAVVELCRFYFTTVATHSMSCHGSTGAWKVERLQAKTVMTLWLTKHDDR